MIAEQTDSTLAQVQGRLVRGRRMLRSRMMRRGVSLSLAAGAITSIGAKASAVVTPAVAAATATSCVALKTTGAASVSSAALELARQGAKAMWLASMMKTTAAVGAVLMAAGIAWAVQADGRGAGTGPANGVSDAAAIELQAEAAVAPRGGTGGWRGCSRTCQEKAGRQKQ